MKDRRVVEFAAARIIGREQELATLGKALQQAQAGQGSLALIGGAAGIGKTTLVNQLAWNARQLGFRVRTGHCYDLETTPPYGPWNELLRSVDGDDDSAPALSPPLLDGTGQGALTSPEDLRGIVVEYLTEIAARRPLLLVLEDLHWADQASLDLARSFARRLAGRSVLLIITYRDVELAPQQPLYHLLPHLARESASIRMALRPLAHEAVRRLISERYDLPDDEETRLSAYLEQHGEGNPFFIEELLGSLEYERILQPGDDGWTLGDPALVPLPPLVRQLIDSRLATLSGDARRLIEVAAVIGTEVPLDLWQAAVEEPDIVLTAALDEALAARLLVETPGAAALRFRHALIHRALYEGMLLTRRRAWHRRIGEILAQQPMVDPTTVAHHFWQAGDERAFEWLIEAGARAHRLYAPDSAIEHYSRAFELAASQSIEIPVAALQARGEAYAIVGNFDLARADYLAALEKARSTHDQRAELGILIGLGSLWSERDYARTGEYVQAALTLAQTRDDPAMLAHGLSWAGTWRLNIGEATEAIDYHERAMAAFERIEDRHGIATTDNMLAMDNFIRGDMIQAWSHARRAADGFRAEGNQLELASTLHFGVGCRGVYDFATELPTATSPDEVASIAGQAIGMCRDIPWRAGEAFTRVVYSGYLGLHGHYGPALDMARTALSITEEIGHREWTAVANDTLGNINLDLLDFPVARRNLERARALATEIGSFIHLHVATANFARACVLMGDLDEARMVLDALLRELESADTAVERHCWRACAELALASGDPELALTILEHLIATTPNGAPGLTNPHLSHPRGLALVALGRAAEAGDAFSTAQATAERFGRRPLLWRILADRARLFIQQGDHAEAARAAAAASDIVNELAATLEDETRRAQYLNRALAQIPSPAPDNVANLSPRELEVLRLAANGMTNAEIGEQLHISPRTVHGHLQSTFNKLGVNSRTAAAAFAFEHNLV